MKSYRSRAKKRAQMSRIILLVIGLGLIFASLIIALRAYTQYAAQPEIVPYQTEIEGIPLGGLLLDEASQRIQEAFNLPVELQYKTARMQFPPAELGFQLDLAAILEQIPRTTRPISFKAWFFGKNPGQEAKKLELAYTLDEAHLQNFLNETFTQRYDQPAVAPAPILYSTNLTPGQPGYQLSSISQTVEQVKRALTSPTERIVNLTVNETPAPALSWQNLETMVRQLVKLERFNGLFEIYLRDMKTDQLMHFAIKDQQDVPVDVAYSAASTIKIPIMVSTMRRLEAPIPNQALNWMAQMIGESLNPPADGLMKAYMDNQNGPLMVTADMRELGYQNTFLAGYFEPGSPLLERIDTPANQRRDVYLDPDLYNQTVPSETGDLLTRLYRCASSPQTSLFNGQVNQEECEIMLGYLKGNKILALLEAGLPPEASIAHKHGWTNETDGLIHTISDASVIYTPGGDYVLVVFAHTENQFLYDYANRIFARLAQSIYNAYNLENQTFWYEN